MKIKYIRKIISVSILLLLVFVFSSFSINAQPDFSDVPSNHWAKESIYKLKSLGISEGIGDNKFGLGQKITKAEFATFLCKIMNWQIISPEFGTFSDNQNKSSWYFSYIETALANNAILKDTDSFNPNKPITRKEMAVMIVRSLGYEELSNSLSYLPSPFTDVKENKTHIIIAKDLGIISGMGNNLFMPESTATREQAAAMLVNLENAVNRKLEFKNAFYAINSYSQKDYINQFDNISFGWARLEIEDGNVILNTTSKNNNEYNIPNGYSEPIQISISQNKSKMLMPFVKNEDAFAILKNPELRTETIKLMVNAVNGLHTENNESISFDGVVVDFEGLKGNEMKENLNSFLKELRKEIGNKKIFVAVHPKRRSNHEYFDGYDYKTIGNISDKVILMAHDYNPVSLNPEEMNNSIVMTPVAPIDEVYYALREITNNETGISDKSKILLQISFGIVQWKVIDGKVINSKPFKPTEDKLQSLVSSGKTTYNFNEKYMSPYITYFNDSDNTNNVIWFEDTKSVSAKINLAKAFGIDGISVWRIGTINSTSGIIDFRKY